MKKIFVMTLTFAILLSNLTGCLVKLKTKIYVTSYPMEYLANKIGGKYVEVINVSDGKLMQTSNFKKEYISDFTSKDLFVYIQGLEPYMPLYIDQIRDTKIQMFDASLHATSDLFGRFEVISSTDGTTSATVQLPYFKGADFESMDTFSNDPFLWMDPMLMMGIAEALTVKMSSMDKINSKFFVRNLDQLKIDLARLDAEYHDFKNNYPGVKVATMTNSYGNWQRSFYVHVNPIMVSRYGTMPNEAQYQVIKQRLIDDQVKYIAFEPNLTPQMVEVYQRLVSELGLLPIDLHNLSALMPSDIEKNKDYITIMYENLANLKLIEE